MALVAIITDTHYGVRSDSPAFHEYFRKSSDWFLKVLSEQGIRHVIHAGDLYDRRKIVNFCTAHMCRKTFLEPLNTQASTHIIAGNHDEFYKNTHEVNSLDELVGSRYANIKVHTRPVMINIDGLDIHLFPWITDSNREESVHALKTSPAPIAIGHFDVKGFELFKGVLSDVGFSVGDFARFDAVYSGHYHHKSSISNVHYIGGFTEHTWADHHDPRGFSVLDTETRKVTFYLNPYNMFKAMIYDDSENTELHKMDLSEYRDCYVKVLVRHKNPFLFDLFIEALGKVSPVDVTILEDAAMFREQDPDGNVDEAEDTNTILGKYIDGLKLQVDPGLMKKFMRDVYREAVSSTESED